MSIEPFSKLPLARTLALLAGARLHLGRCGPDAHFLGGGLPREGRGGILVAADDRWALAAQSYCWGDLLPAGFAVELSRNEIWERR